MKECARQRKGIVKGRLCAALALILLAVTAGSALAQSFGVIYRTDTLNLRSEGSSSSRWLGSYPGGTWVEITGSQNNFYYVRTPDGKTGYMSKNYINTAGSGSVVRIAVVSNRNGGAFLNFRAQPDYNAPVLGIFYDGVPLFVASELNGWYCVEINGQVGYVRSEYVTVTDMLGSSTVATIKTPNNTAMNLRYGPGTGYGVVKQFPGDRYVMVLAKGSNWWRVAIDGYTGFMSKDFLVEGLYSAKDIAAQNGGGSGGASYAVVNNPKNTQALNLRRSASTGAAVLDKLYNGARLWVDEQGSEWCAVTVQDTGVSGYVMTRYITLYNLPAAPSRMVSHPNGTFVNLRSAPDMTYSNVRVRVPSGRSVTILIPGSDWCKVQYNGYTGYMLTYFLK